ncbi:uncharacterized protein C2845_PM05G36790 [Panicum miliaceum]|uniref:Uncharacterized protein n=1 Tax=Panicum miliaceum TaxID=4540 RepID=A0A3L6T5W0_PANMI|nr:uncharacterized protein C2845_PM05G36790 [Panicum miliaceum]
MAAVLQEEPVMGGSSLVAPAGTDRLDLEAAEQLIQLSGSPDDDGGSESRSADSVKCHRGSKDKEAAVESRRRGAARPVAAAGKDKKPDSKGAAESFACSTAAGVEEKDNRAVVVVESPRRSGGRHPAAAGKDLDGGIVHGEARRRPKFRSLAAIYRETEPIARRVPLAGGGGEGHADRDPPEGERKKTKKRAGDEVIPVDAEASKAKREDRYMRACVS